MFRRNLIAVWIGIILLSGMFLMGQETWVPPAKVSVSILVQVDPLFPSEFDALAAGDPVPNAEVQIMESGEIVASGFSNSEGEVVLEVPASNPYSMHVVADTSDPDCRWRARVLFFSVGTEPRDVSVDVWPDGPGCVGPLVEVSLLVQVAPLFPYEIDGLKGGDPVPSAEVEITKRMTDELIASGVAGANGEILLEVPGINRYYIHAAADTSDPYCIWSGWLDVVVGTEPLDATVNVWLLCE